MQIPGLFNLLPNATPVASVMGVNQICFLLRHADRDGTISAPNPCAVENAAACRGVGICRFIFGRENGGVFPRAIHETGDAGHHDCHVPLYFSEKRLGAGGAHRKLTRRETLWGLFFGAFNRFLRRHFRAGNRQPAGFRVRPFLRLRFPDGERGGQSHQFDHQPCRADIFIPQGHVVWAWAVPLALANLCGSVVGARLAIRGGTRFLRYGFMLLLCLTIGKFAWDLLS